MTTPRKAEPRKLPERKAVRAETGHLTMGKDFYLVQSSDPITRKARRLVKQLSGDTAPRSKKREAEPKQYSEPLNWTPAKR